jgi:hypothetical protein
VRVVVADPVVVMVAAEPAVPVIVSDCGEFAALSVMVKGDIRTPAACGENTIAIVQDAFAAMEPLYELDAILKSDELNPLRRALRT